MLNKRASLSSMKKKLDIIFSQFIRLRDCNGHLGYGKCISCGKTIQYNFCDAGHYVNRKHMSLRYCEQNVFGQCRACNRFDEGNKEGYIRGLIAKVGQDKIDIMLSKKHDKSPDKIQLEAMIVYYKEKVRAINGN